MEHHPIFHQFQCWEGECEPEYVANFIGVKTRREYLYIFSPERSARETEKKFITTSYPSPSETYFEWISLFESIQEARDTYTIVELGAGMGRNILNAAVAIRSYYGQEFPFHLVAVEAEPTYFKWIQQHLLDNGINPEEHQLINAAVSNKDGHVTFTIGAHATYGNGIAHEAEQSKGIYKFLQSTWAKIFGYDLHLTDHLNRDTATRRFYDRRVKALSVNTILRPLDSVDLIHCDIQGAELEAFHCAKDQLDSKVKRVHIGTHSAHIDESLRTLFKDLGWECIFDYPTNGICSTPYGEVDFQDGIQAWRNPKLSQ